MANNKILTLGGGILKLNDVDVGHLNGTVQLNYQGDAVDFMSSNKLSLTRRFRSSERVTLTASLAELSCANMRLALGHTTAIISSNSFPAYDPSSYTIVAGSSYDIVKFGGDTSVAEVSLQFVHTRPKDSAGLQEVIVVVLYAAVSNFNLNLPFDRETMTFQDVEWEAVGQQARAAGDQLGMVACQVDG